MKELKEFTTKLKSLPEIQRHIDLLSHLNITLSKSEFNERIQLQHALLGDPASDAEYQLIEVYTKWESSAEDLSSTLMMCKSVMAIELLVM